MVITEDRREQIHKAIEQQIQAYKINHDTRPNTLYLDIRTIEIIRRGGSWHGDITTDSFGIDIYPILTYFGLIIIPVLSSCEHINVAYKE